MRIDSFTGEYAFLSNFSSSIVELDGRYYPTVEHAYQAAKSLDKQDRAKILLLGSTEAGKAKRLGRTFRLRPDWDDIRVDVMYTLLCQKFKRNSGLGIWLVETGDAELIEGNHWGDTFWGVCNGIGDNMLGNLLMARRAELEV